VSTAEKRYSVEEYLAFERSSQTKHEYFDGDIREMPRCNATHCLISANVCGEFGNALRRSSAVVLGSLMRMRCPTGLYTYADMVVAHSPTKFLDDEQDVLLNPSVIAEVYSNATRSYKCGAKRVNYQTIDSLQHLMLVATDRPFVEIHTREADGSWTPTAYDDLSQDVALRSIECVVPMTEIYAKVEFK
jgi:Uma2 family endonuclease